MDKKSEYRRYYWKQTRRCAKAAWVYFKLFLFPKTK
jgi:hypothetical protein